MHRRLEAIVDLLSKADPESGKQLVRAFFIDELFQFLGRTQCLFLTATLPYSTLPLTTCMFTVAPTGGGKSRIKTSLGYIFKEYQQAYSKALQEKLGKYNEYIESEAIVKFGDSDKQASKRDAYFKANSINGFVRVNDQIGTSQGVAQAVNTMKLLKLGSYCHRFDECAKTIVSSNQNTRDFLENLLSFTGGATTIGRTIKGEVLELDATGVSFNIHFFGNEEPLGENPRNLSIFRAFLREGFSRRCFYTYIKERPSYTREDMDVVPDESKFKTFSNHFLSEFNRLAKLGNKVFTFTDEAKKFLKDYKFDNRLPTGNVDADNERIDHTFKCQKMACALAFLDGTFLVDEGHCISAMQYVKESANAYLELLGSIQRSVQSKTDTYPLQIFEELSQKGTLTKKPLLRSLHPSPQGQSSEKWESYIADASKFAEEEGFFLIAEPTKNGRGMQYRLEEMQETTEAMVTYSIKVPDVIEKEKDGVKYLDYKNCFAKGYEVFNTTLDVFSMFSSCLHVSPAIFKDGHRSTDNVEYLGNLAFFDIDNDVTKDAMLTIEDAQRRLFGYQGVIIESMSSTIEQPRFRAVVVLDKPVKGISKESYKQVLNNIAKHLGIDGAIDKSCIEPARYYAQTNKEGGVGVYYSNMYGKPLEWESFLGVNPSVSKPTVYSKAIIDFSHDEVKRRFNKAVQTSVKKYWREGVRNNLVYYLAKLGKEKGIVDADIKQIIENETHGSCSALSTQELESTITNSNRY